MTINVILNKTQLIANIIYFDNNYSMENFLNFINNERQALSGRSIQLLMVINVILNKTQLIYFDNN